MRYQDVRYGKDCNQLGCPELTTHNDKVKDDSFSLTDGLKDENWNVVIPFDVAQPTSPLAAPTEAISDVLGVSPSEVVSPEQSIPLDSKEVLPPEQEETNQEQETKQNANTTPLTQFDLTKPLPGINELGNEEAEVTAPDVEQEGSLPNLSSLPDLGNTDSQKPIELVPPSSALPEVLTDLDVSEVAAPTQTNTPDTTTEDVLPPDNGNVPSLGASPSDGSLDVVPPSGIGGVVPPIDSEVTPIDAVIPPIGWEGEATVSVFNCDIANPLDCSDPNNGIPSVPDEVTDQASKDKANQDASVGENDVNDSDVEAAKDKAVKAIAPKLPNRSPELVKAQLDDILASLEDLSPREKLLVLQALEEKIVTGNYNDYEDMTQKTPLDVAWAAARLEGPDYFGISYDERAFAVIDALGLTADFFSQASDKTIAGLAEFYAHNPGNLLEIHNDDLLTLLEGADALAGSPVGSPLELLLDLADAGLSSSDSGLQNVKIASVIKTASGTFIILDGAVDILISVNKYDDLETKTKALQHATGRTVASGIAGFGVGALGGSLTASGACGPYAPACAVGVIVTSGAAAFAADWFVQQDEIPLPFDFQLKGLGWNY